MIKIILHLAVIVKDINHLKDIVHKLVTHELKFPSIKDFEIVVADLFELVDLGLILIPGLDKTTLDHIVQSIKDALKQLESPGIPPTGIA